MSQPAIRKAAALQTHHSRVLFGIAATILIAAIAVAAVRKQQFVEVGAEMQLSHRRIGWLASLTNGLESARSSVRGYLLTGDPRFLQDLRDSAAAVANAVERGENMADGETFSIAEISTLKDRTNAWLDSARRTTEAHRQGAARGVAQLADSDNEFDSIVVISENAKARAGRVLSDQINQQQILAREASLWLAALGAISLIFLITALILQNRWLSRRNAIDEEAARFASVMENVLEGVARLDGNGRYAEVNRAYAETLGFDAPDLTGLSPTSTMPLDYAAQFESAIARSRTHGKAAVEVRQIHKDGHWVDLMVTVMCSPATRTAESTYYLFQKNVTPERKALRALREATALKQAIFDSANFAIIATTPDGCIRTLNAGAQKMLGYKQSELLGLPLLRVLHDSRELAAAQFADFESFTRVARKGIPDERCWTYRRKDGTLVPVRVSLTALGSATGEILGFVAVAQDLTHEQVLREESNKLASLVQASKDFVVTFGVDGRVLFVNETGKQLIGYDHLAVTNKPNIKAYMAPEFRRLLRHKVIPALRESGYWNGDVALTHCVTGDRLEMEANVFEVREPGSDKLLCIGAVLRDVRERRRQQETLQLQARILDQVHDAVTSINMEGSFTSWNQGAERIFGYTAAEALGQPVAFLLPPNRQEWVAAGLLRLVQERGQYESEVEVIQKSGNRITVHNSFTPQRDSSGRMIGLITASQEITARKRAEAALRLTVEELTEAKSVAEQASRVKSEFLAVMSHEIRTPLNGIIGMTQMLETSRLSSDEAEAVQTIRSSSEILLAIINDVLDFSKIEAGKLDLEWAVFSPLDLIQEGLSLVTPLARAKGLTLTLAKSPGTPNWVKGDRLRIRQILLNLLSNAIKFSEAGTIRLELELLASAGSSMLLQFDVVDQGVGIAEESLERLFLPFSQADASTTRRFAGTGLGLAICRRLVELMGGEIGVTSRLGEGSRFWFRIPLDRARQPETAPSSLSAPDIELQALGASILLAEDNIVNQRVAVRMLSRLGCQVDIASNGQEALDAITSRPYDLVLMDLLMPVMDGLEATRQIRAREQQHPAAHRIPIIALTANAFAEDRQRCLESGMDDFLPKPLRWNDLHTTVRRWTASAVKDLVGS